MRSKLLLLAAAAATISTAALAQDVGRPPSFGTLNLSAGFSNDPRTVDVTAGGTRDASALGDGCVGSIANSPDVRLNYNAGSYPLILSVDSSDDTTLVVNTPDGEWHCDDDGGERGTNPSIRFSRPQSGQYDIYVGHYGEGRGVSARLYVSEVTSR